VREREKKRKRERERERERLENSILTLSSGYIDLWD
jgi:hypothetical protein